MYVGGSWAPIVRDITDFAHPAQVAGLAYTADPQAWNTPVFASAFDVSWSDVGLHLYRAVIATGDCVLLSKSDYAFFAWSPDGTTVFYENMVGTYGSDARLQLRRIHDGVDTLIEDAIGYPSGCDGGFGCDSSQRALMSPDGRYLALTGSSGLRVWDAEGRAVSSGIPRQAGQIVWSGTGLYYNDFSSKGVQVWREGSVSPFLPGVTWAEPNASPAGGQIVFTVEDASNNTNVDIVDTQTGRVRELAKSVDNPMFLNERYVWLEGVRLCKTPPVSDGCIFSGPVHSGKNFIYDLQTGALMPSDIDRVADVWPHAA